MLGWYNLRVGKSYAKAPTAVAKGRDFIAVGAGAEELERRWKVIEDRIPALRDAIEHGVGPLSSADQDIARQVIALHWARGKTAVELEKVMVPLAVGVARRELVERQPDVVTEAFYQRYRVVPPAGRGPLDYYVEQNIEFSTEAHEQSFAARVVHNFETAVAGLARFQIEVWEAAPDTEFVLSDIGALTVDPTKTLGGPLHGVPWSSAVTVLLPMSPRFLIAAGNTSRRGQLGGDEMSKANSVMVWSSVENVVHRVDPVIEALVRDTWARRPQARGNAYTFDGQHQI
jgi:hypothetical protein